MASRVRARVVVRTCVRDVAAKYIHTYIQSGERIISHLIIAFFPPSAVARASERPPSRPTSKAPKRASRLRAVACTLTGYEQQEGFVTNVVTACMEPGQPSHAMPSTVRRYSFTRESVAPLHQELHVVCDPTSHVPPPAPFLKVGRAGRSLEVPEVPASTPLVMPKRETSPVGRSPSWEVPQLSSSCATPSPGRDYQSVHSSEPGSLCHDGEARRSGKGKARQGKVDVSPGGASTAISAALGRAAQARKPFHGP